MRALVCVVVLVIVGTLSPAVRAQPQSAVDEAMTRYFAGETAEGYAWLGAGNASLAAGGALVAQKDGVLRGMSYPLLGFGVIQLVAGMSSLTRNEGRVANLRRAIAADPAAARSGEAARIGRVNSLFKVIKIAEYTLLGLGAAGAVIGGALEVDELLGAGIGLVAESALMLVLDHFAERRAHRYAEALGAISFSVAPRPGRVGDTALVLGFSRRF